MTRDEVKVAHGPGVIKRLISRVRSNSDIDHGTNAIAIPKSYGYSNGANYGSHGSYGSYGSYERNRGRTPSFKTPSFMMGSSTSSTSPPRGKKGSVSSVRPHAEAGLSRDLWDEAYEAMRTDPSTMSLVVTYESIISQQLPDELKVACHATISSPDGNTDRRMELMAAIAQAGLAKRRGSKTSQVDDSARQILEYTKRIVEGQLDDFPSAALAWSGLCTLTPLLIDPILRHDEFRRGMIHIIGRIPWYMHLTHLLQCPSWVDADDFDARQHQFQYRRERAKDEILRLYRRVIEFEMNCVCATASAWNTVAKHAVRWQSLGKLVDSIEDADERLRDLVKDFVVEGSRRDQMLARDVDLDVEALERARSREEVGKCIVEEGESQVTQ